MNFEKYQHVERYGTDATDGILDGIVYVFYKLDGTNGSVWLDTSQDRVKLAFGSRNRRLSLENDNAGFMNAMVKDQRLLDMFEFYPEWRLYGEWLVPHSLKTYRDDAWRKFYVFDVTDKEGNAISYDDYKPILDSYNLDYIPPLCIMKNPTDEQVLKCLDKSGQFLVEDGKGKGEGIVLKNYSYYNKWGNQTWAKIVTNEFKEVHHKEMGAPLINGSLMVEERIVEDFLTEAFILKEKAKIELQNDGWSNKCIPELLGRVFHELIQEETWNIVRKYKNPKINFGLLNKMVLDKTKKTIGL